jgi:hypothetical protein
MAQGIPNTFGNTPLHDKVAPQVKNANKISKVYGLSKSQTMQLRQGGDTIYIYNVSPIFSWTKPVQGRGRVTVPKRDPKAKYSEAVEIPPYVVCEYDKGNRNRAKYLEIGKDIAEDIVGHSPEYPIRPENDLTLYGLFFTIGTKLEDMGEEEREELLNKANLLHENKCREKVLEADSFHDADHTSWITEVHRLCAMHVHEEREWVARRGKTMETSECPYCGFEGKKGTVICRNCKEVLDKEGYDKLKGKKKDEPKKE